MAKQYKPGQFVRIYGKQHRVTKASFIDVCNHCSYKWSNFAGHICIKCTNLLPLDCYPKPI